MISGLMRPNPTLCSVNCGPQSSFLGMGKTSDAVPVGLESLQAATRFMRSPKTPLLLDDNPISETPHGSDHIASMFTTYAPS